MEIISISSKKKSERELAEETTFQKNSNLLKKELEWMRRMPKARTTKSKSRIDAFHTLKDKTVKSANLSKVSLSVNAARQGNKILEIENISKSYTQRKIIDTFSYTFKKGDKIGVAGKNGLGKSTFLNILTGAETPDQGLINIGETTVFGYYKQGGLEFNDNDRVIDVAKSVGDYIKMADGTTLSASQLLQHFLFAPSRQYTPVANLSGGEKKRLQLMRILMKNPNFLILDEPTNDLDIDTLNVLEDFLEKFPGILVLVSHDRYLLDKLTDQLFIFEGNGSLIIYSGNYTDYRLEASEKVKHKNELSKKEDISKSITNKKRSYKETLELEEIEKTISVLESNLRVETARLNQVNDHLELLEISNIISNLQNELDQKTERWIELSE